MKQHPENLHTNENESIQPLKEMIVWWVQRTHATTDNNPVTFTLPDPDTSPSETLRDWPRTPTPEYLYVGYEAQVGKLPGGKKIYAYLGADNEILADTPPVQTPVGPYRALVRVRYSKPGQEDEITSFFLFEPFEIIQEAGGVITGMSNKKSIKEKNLFNKTAKILWHMVSDIYFTTPRNRAY